MSHNVEFQSYYAQCFYLITLFLHDPSHDFLDGKRPIEAFEVSPDGQKNTIQGHGSYFGGGTKMVGGGGAAEEWEQVQEAMTPIYQQWMQQGAPGASDAAAYVNLKQSDLDIILTQADIKGRISSPLQLIWMLKSQSPVPGGELLPLSVQLARAAAVSPSIQQILQNYLLTYDTIDNLHGSFFIENQLFQRIGTHTHGDLSCQLGNTCLVDVGYIDEVAKNLPFNTFEDYDGLVASNGNFFLPIGNTIQVARIKDIVGNVGYLIRVDLAAQNVPMHTVGYWNIKISYDGMNVIVTQGFEGGEPGHIPHPQVLSTQPANNWFQNQFGFAMNCGVQALLSTWLRVGIALDQIRRAASFTRDVDSADAEDQIFKEGLINLRASTNYYTQCVVNDECDIEDNTMELEQGGGGMMSGGRSLQREEKVKIAYSWYMAVALNSVYFPLQKTIPKGTPNTIKDQINVQKLLMNQSLKIILPLVTMGQKGNTKLLQQAPKGSIDKKLLVTFKQIVCSNCEKGSCNYGGVLLEAKPLNKTAMECRQEVSRTSKPGQTKLVLGAAGQQFPFLHLIGQKTCNNDPCGEPVVSGGMSLGEQVSTYFTEKTQQNKKFLINNALSTKSTYIPKAIKFCPESSIFDPMSMCSSGTIQSDGIEIGNMDVTIHYKDIAGYRIRVTVNDGNQPTNIGSPGWDFANVSFNIVADLKIGKERLLNNLTIPIAASDAWGKGGIFGAANVLMELGQIVDELNTKFTGGKKNLRDLYNWVGTDGNDQKKARSAIVGVLFKKGLGDNLQELNGVITNGGYITGERGVSTQSILPPNEGRMMLGTDQPSAVRAMFLVMMGQGAINNNAVAGYVGADGQYILAARANFGAGLRGGGRRKKIYKKRRRSRKRKGKTKKYKKKKYVKTLKGRKYKKKSRRKR